MDVEPTLEQLKQMRYLNMVIKEVHENNISHKHEVI